jgi:DNA (cytosine-5)-methyltransferase 1
VQVGWGWRTSEIAADRYLEGNEWTTEPALGRVAYGVPYRLERLGALGNALVPQIPEIIGRAILSSQQGENK